MDAGQLVLLFHKHLAMRRDHEGVTIEEDLLMLLRTQLMQVNLDTYPYFLVGPIAIDERVHACALFLKNKLAGPWPDHLITVVGENLLGDRLNLIDRAIRYEDRGKAIRWGGRV
jgi:hypothetical protein